MDNNINTNSSLNSNINTAKASSHGPSRRIVSGHNIFFVIFMVLFVITFSHYIRTGVFIDFTFKSLIEYLSGMPDIVFSMSKVSLSIGGNWGWFDSFRLFLNGITGVFEFALMIISMCGQSLVVVGYLVGLLFI